MHDYVSAVVLSEGLALVFLAVGRANLAALEVHWFQCGLGGELASDPSLAEQEAKGKARAEAKKLKGRMMDKRNVRLTWADWLLLTAIIGLSAYLLVLLLGPTVEAWRHRPLPGIQVSQQYTMQEDSGNSTVAMPVNYLLYLPADYTWRSKWPLVVYLHGSGSRGQDLNLVRREGLAGLVEQGKKFNFILLSPQCPAHSWWPNELVVDLIEHISSSLSVDRERVYLTGYSMGGFGVWRSACYDPSRFAAIAPLCGGGDPDQAERLMNVPVWAFHGEKDQVIPLKLGKAMVDAVKNCGGQVKFTVYPNEGHGICGLTYQNEQLYEWLLAQRRGREAAVAANRSLHR